MNARRRHRMGDAVLEQKMTEPEPPQAKPKPPKAKIPKKGAETVHGQWLNGRWRDARTPGEPWPDGTFECVPHGPPGWVSQIEKEKVEARKPKSTMLQRRPRGRIRVSTNHRRGKMVEIPGFKGPIDRKLINFENREDGPFCFCKTIQTSNGRVAVSRRLTTWCV